MVFRPKIKSLYNSNQVLIICEMTLITGKQPKQSYFNDFFWHPFKDQTCFIQISFQEKEIVIVDIGEELRSRVKSLADTKRFKLIEFYPSHAKGEHISDIKTMKSGTNSKIIRN